MELWYLISAHHLIMLYICTKFQENTCISKGFRATEWMQLVSCILKFSKGHNSVNSVGGVMVLDLSTLSDSILYLYKVLSKYLIGFQSY